MTVSYRPHLYPMMNHNYVKSKKLRYFFIPIAIPFAMIDKMLEDMLPERYLPPHLVDQVWGKYSAQELRRLEFQVYYAASIRSGIPLPA